MKVFIQNHWLQKYNFSTGVCILIALNFVTLNSCRKDQSLTKETLPNEVSGFVETDEARSAKYEDFTYRHFRYFKGNKPESYLHVSMQDEFKQKMDALVKKYNGLSFDDKMNAMAADKVISEAMKTEMKRFYEMSVAVKMDESYYDNSVQSLAAIMPALKTNTLLTKEEYNTLFVMAAQMKGFLKYAKEVDYFHVQYGSLRPRCDKGACLDASVYGGTALGFLLFGPAGAAVGFIAGILIGDSECCSEVTCNTPTLYIKNYSCNPYTATIRASYPTGVDQETFFINGYSNQFIPTSSRIEIDVEQNNLSIPIKIGARYKCSNGLNDYTSIYTFNIAEIAGGPGLPFINSPLYVSATNHRVGMFPVSGLRDEGVCSYAVVQDGHLGDFYLDREQKMIFVYYYNQGVCAIRLKSYNLCSGRESVSDPITITVRNN